MISIDEQLRVLSRRCERILSEQDLKNKLKKSAETGKPLRIKLGMDPTAPDVTLGHAVPLSVVRQFQEWGHKAVLIIGDYTARVGDPTGPNKTRPQLTGEEIDSNAKTYVAQVGKILLTDPEHLEVRYNSEWLGKMGMVDIIKLASRATVAQMLTREDFANRYKEGTEIRLHEILYPLLQGWDSVMIDADVEMGGSDQLFNNLVGREFQKEEGKEGQVVIVTPLLVGTDGAKKMSKSQKNYIGVTETPEEMYRKTLRLKTDLMEMYFRLLTEIPVPEYQELIKLNAHDAHIVLAKAVVGRFHGLEGAARAEEELVRTSHGGIPADLPEFTVSRGCHLLASLIRTAKFGNSGSEGRRLIEGKAVRINGVLFTDPRQQIILGDPNGAPQVPAHPAEHFDEPIILQSSKSKFARIKFD